MNTEKARRAARKKGSSFAVRMARVNNQLLVNRRNGCKNVYMESKNDCIYNKTIRNEPKRKEKENVEKPVFQKSTKSVYEEEENEA